MNKCTVFEKLHAAQQSHRGVTLTPSEVVVLCGAPGMSKAMSKAERKLGEYDDLMEDARMAGKESTRADAHDEDATSA